MLSKTTLAIAVVLAAASEALAAATTPIVVPSENVYNPMGAHVGTVRDQSIRFELNRDWGIVRY